MTAVILDASTAAYTAALIAELRAENAELRKIINESRDALAKLRARVA